MCGHLAHRLECVSPIGGVANRSNNSQGAKWCSESKTMIPDIMENYWQSRYPRFWKRAGLSPVEYHQEIDIDFRTDGIDSSIMSGVQQVNACDVRGDGASFDLAVLRNSGLPSPVSLKMNKFQCSGYDRVTMHKGTWDYILMVLDCYLDHTCFVWFVYKHTMYIINMHKVLTDLCVDVSTKDKIRFKSKMGHHPVYTFKSSDGYYHLSFKPSLLVSYKENRTYKRATRTERHTKKVWEYLTNNGYAFKVKYTRLTEQGLLDRLDKIDK